MNVRQGSVERRSQSRASSSGDLMVEVGEDDDNEIPGENDEPDMGNGDDEEELVPVKIKGHSGLFGANINSVRF